MSIAMFEIAHWDLSTKNLDSAMEFYRTLFQWKIEKMTDWPDYASISIGEGTMAGGVGKMDQPGTILYVHVPDINTWLAKATEMGATVAVPKTDLPNNMGAFAVFVGPDGTAIGIWAEK